MSIKCQDCPGQGQSTSLPHGQHSLLRMNGSNTKAMQTNIPIGATIESYLSKTSRKFMTTDSRTYDELQEEIRKLEEQAEIAKQSEIEAFLDDVKQKIAKYGLTPAQLGFTAPASSPDGKRAVASKMVVVKYRKGDDTWSGRGRKPQWAKELGDELEKHRAES